MHYYIYKYIKKISINFKKYYNRKPKYIIYLSMYFELKKKTTRFSPFSHIYIFKYI